MNRNLFAFTLLTMFAALLLGACGRAAVAESPLSAVTTTIERNPSATLPSATLPSATLPSATARPTQPTPLPTAEPTAAPSAAPQSRLLSIPAVNCCRGRTLARGPYAVPPWLGLPLAFEVGEGWRVLNEERARLFLLGRGENAQSNPSQIITFIDATGAITSPEEFIAAVQTIPQLTPLGGPVSVAIAGFPGWQLDAVAKPNSEEKGDPSADIPPGIQFLPFFQEYFAPGFIWSTSSPEARVRTAALRVGEQTLVLYMEAPAAEFEQFILDADTILWTLRPSD